MSDTSPTPAQQIEYMAAAAADRLFENRALRAQVRDLQAELAARDSAPLPVPTSCVCEMFVLTKRIWSVGSCLHTMGTPNAVYPVEPYNSAASAAKYLERK